MACRVTTRIRSSTWVLQALLWMLLILARESRFALPSIGEGGEKQPLFYSDIPALTFFSGKVILWCVLTVNEF